MAAGRVGRARSLAHGNARRCAGACRSGLAYNRASAAQAALLSRPLVAQHRRHGRARDPRSRYVGRDVGTGRTRPHPPNASNLPGRSVTTRPRSAALGHRRARPPDLPASSPSGSTRCPAKRASSSRASTSTTNLPTKRRGLSRPRAPEYAWDGSQIDLDGNVEARSKPAAGSHPVTITTQQRCGFRPTLRAPSRTERCKSVSGTCNLNAVGLRADLKGDTLELESVEHGTILH